jgi:hypothetical protein
MRWLHEQPNPEQKEALEIIMVERYLAPPYKMVVGAMNIIVAGPFPGDAEVVIYLNKRIVEVTEKDKPTYEVTMRNLNKLGI